VRRCAVSAAQALRTGEMHWDTPLETESKPGYPQHIGPMAPHGHPTPGKRQECVVVRRYTDFGSPERAACMHAWVAGQWTSVPPAAHPAARIAARPLNSVCRPSATGGGKRGQCFGAWHQVCQHYRGKGQHRLTLKGIGELVCTQSPSHPSVRGPPTVGRIH
jgi:hypothetical protein